MAEVPAGLTLALKAAAPQGQSAEIAWEAAEIDVDVSADVVCVYIRQRPALLSGCLLLNLFSKLCCNQLHMCITLQIIRAI